VFTRRVSCIFRSYCKQEIVSQLALQKAEDGVYPPGFVHLPSDVTEDQVKQITSESLVTKMVKGRVRREWQVIEGRRNEVLDCANYARGLASMRQWDRWRDSRFTEMERLLGADGPDDDGPAPQTPKPPPAPATSLARVLRPVRSRFMG
jgi:phage terminase large subunit GpA-like protein